MDDDYQDGIERADPSQSPRSEEAKTLKETTRNENWKNEWSERGGRGGRESSLFFWLLAHHGRG